MTLLQHPHMNTPGQHLHHQHRLGLCILTNVALFVGFLNAASSAPLQRHTTDIDAHTTLGIDLPQQTFVAQFVLKLNGDQELRKILLSKVGDEHFVFHIEQVWTSMHTSGMKLPWERSPTASSKETLEPFSKLIKLGGNMGPCSNPKPADPVKLFYKKRSSPTDAGLSPIEQTDETSLEQQIGFDRKAAYEKWTVLVLEDPGSWSIARSKPGDALMDFLQQSLSESMKDTIEIKTTSNLQGRANPPVSCGQFARDHNAEPFPIKGLLVYKFLNDSDTAPRFPRFFITLVPFAKHITGWMQADEVLNSGRDKAHTAIHLDKKCRIVQRPPLTAKQIKHLEIYIKYKNRPMYDCIAPGIFLLRVSGHFRLLDRPLIASMGSEVLDGANEGYLECAAERCKTATTLEKRTELRPLVVSTLSLTDGGWDEPWFECSEHQGLVLRHDKPVLPNPAVGRGWTRVPVSCEAAGYWIRSLLEDAPSRREGVKISAPSCKFSMSPMCAKHGMEPAAKRCRGLHVKSTLTCIREAMYCPVGLTGEMATQINDSNFEQVATRGGYFPAGPAGHEGEDQESSSLSSDSKYTNVANTWPRKGPWRKFQANGGDTMVYFRYLISLPACDS